MRLPLLSAALLLAVSAAPLRAAPSPAPTWVDKSNADSQILMKAIGSFSPEEASGNGLREYDPLVSDLREGYEDRVRAALIPARDTLRAALAAETDPRVREDIEILLHDCDLRIEEVGLDERLTLSYVDVGRAVFSATFGLLNEEVAPERRPAALARLRKYAGLEAGTTPFAVQAEEMFRRSLSNPSRVGPFRGEVEASLAASDRYVTGMRKLFEKNSFKDAGPALDAFAAQMTQYNDWVRREVLPRSRADFRLPPELYAFRLRKVGLGISPEELIQKAEFEYANLQDELATTAAIVAKERGLADSDYRSVIRELKKEQMTTAELEPYYHGVIAKIEETVRRVHMISLPDRPLEMRLASDAETAAQPAPHYLPPPLVGNAGERGVFVLPLNNPQPGAKAADAYDDFSFKAAAWTLSAHEGRPGHDLQFTAMIERGVSQARSIFAFNSVNVEGWALYSEAMFRPYEPPEGQLVTLQLRLLRAARAILDPELNLGLITRDRAHDILTRDVCLSEAFAAEELDRFTFRSPGQATAYFYGFSKLMALRAETEIALGPKFDLFAFNNFVIQQGLLPPDLLAKAVETEFIPSQKG